jgi:alanyl-tRNA synthetase
MTTTNQLRELYLEFFKSKGHAVIPSASLVPENDPTALFISAGMHPLVPYLLGEPHPKGKRLVNYQRCLRTTDIDEVGDPWHLTFFEMLGNWSLGDYWKKESIAYSWEFLTSKKWLGLDPNKIAVTVFAGDGDAPRDLESAEAWRTHGVPKDRIYFLGKEANWWGPVGETGPTGPDTEIFYDSGVSYGEHSVSGCGPACACGRWVEIWNNVFMEYEKHPDGSYTKLHQQNVDTGMGLERTTAVLNGFESNFEVDTIKPLISEIKVKVPELDVRGQRIAADHLRAATMIIMDGVEPSNKDRGYLLRRLLRKVMSQDPKLREEPVLADLIGEVIEIFKEVYPKIVKEKDRIVATVNTEREKFNLTFVRGERHFYTLAEKGKITGKEAFDLYASFGFPLDATLELARKANASVDTAGFQEEFKKHQEVSRAGAQQRFKGGLSEQSEQTARLHTATHMLQAALRAILGEHVLQKGSNITPERLRFDFSHPDKLTPDQITAVEDLVNEKIHEDLPVVKEIVSYQEGVKRGAIGVLEAKPGEEVSIYSIPGFSMEFCGGPHVTHTGELGQFKIVKEESVAAGIRRIKATVD